MQKGRLDTSNVNKHWLNKSRKKNGRAAVDLNADKQVTLLNNKQLDRVEKTSPATAGHH